MLVHMLPKGSTGGNNLIFSFSHACFALDKADKWACGNSASFWWIVCAVMHLPRYIEIHLSSGDALTYLFSEGFPCRPNCSSIVRSWTDTDTPIGWGAPTPAASRPNQVPCDRVSSGAGSGSSARTALSALYPSEAHWKTDLVVTPRVPDLSALAWKENNSDESAVDKSDAILWQYSSIPLLYKSCRIIYWNVWHSWIDL